MQQPVNEAFEMLYRKESSNLRAFVRSRVRESMDAEDIVQDVWARVYQSLLNGQTIDNLAAWLYTTTKNRITDYYRHRLVQQRLMVQGAEAELRSSQVGREDRLKLDDALLWKAIEEGINQLPAAQRDIFRATEMEERSFKEMSAELNEPLGTLLSRKHHATRKLRKYLNAFYEEMFNI